MACSRKPALYSQSCLGYVRFLLSLPSVPLYVHKWSDFS